MQVFSHIIYIFGYKNTQNSSLFDACSDWNLFFVDQICSNILAFRLPPTAEHGRTADETRMVAQAAEATADSVSSVDDSVAEARY